jgi:hypothetical protein
VTDPCACIDNNSSAALGTALNNTTHPIVGLQLVNGFAEHFRPKLAANELHNIQRLDKAISVSR